MWGKGKGKEQEREKEKGLGAKEEEEEEEERIGGFAVVDRQTQSHRLMRDLFIIPKSLRHHHSRFRFQFQFFFPTVIFKTN